MGLNVGDQASDFTLKQKVGEGLEDVSLSGYRGKKNVVLLFFPLAYTSVCTDEMCSVSGGLAEYESLDAQVLGISVDSPFSQEAWAKENGITIPLLSDFNKEVSASYGAQYEDLLGFRVWPSVRHLWWIGRVSSAMRPYQTILRRCPISRRSKLV